MADIEKKAVLDEAGMNTLIDKIKANIDEKFISNSDKCPRIYDSNNNYLCTGYIYREEDYTAIYLNILNWGGISYFKYDTDDAQIYYSERYFHNDYYYYSESCYCDELMSKLDEILNPTNSNNKLNLDDKSIIIEVSQIINQYKSKLRSSCDSISMAEKWIGIETNNIWNEISYRSKSQSYQYSKLQNMIMSKYSSNTDLIHGAYSCIEYSDSNGCLLNNKSFSLPTSTSYRPALIMDSPSVVLKTKYNSNEKYLSFDINASNNIADLGSTRHKWNAIYAVNGTIQTSDRTQKNSITPLDDASTKNFIMGLIPSHYKMNQGSSGRTHYGLIAQDVEDLMNSLNMESTDFAGFIKSPRYNEIWEDEDGNKLKSPKREIIEGEYDYSLRYDEFISPIIKMIQIQQKTIESLEKRIEVLEANQNTSKTE